MDYKKIAKYAGKTVATIVCPPLGGALWPKEAYNKVIAAVAGVVGSFIFSAALIGTIEKQIYDKPLIKIIKPFDLTNVRKACTSPLEFYFFPYENTRLEKDRSFYYISGDDVITFNNGRYDLNFGSERKFGYSFKGKSVVQAQEQVKKYDEKSQETITRCEEILEAYLKQGSLLDARRERENLDKLKLLKQEKLGKLEANLETVTKEYNETKTVFQEAVDKMNSELECLAQGKN